MVKPVVLYRPDLARFQSSRGPLRQCGRTREICPQRDATSPAPSQTMPTGMLRRCGPFAFLPKLAPTPPGGFAPVPGTTRSWCERGSVNDVGRVLLGLVRDAGSGAKWLLPSLDESSLAFRHIALTIALISFRKNPSIWRYRQPLPRAHGDAELYFSSQHHVSQGAVP
ncbi:hypothetical protein F4814DRAFT_448304 [Daldinia grandis]|nr:hypothetical protein F4814DRAFT_448304 [Daldinia grandis]